MTPPFVVDISHEETVLISRSQYFETYGGRGALKLWIPENVIVPDGEYQFFGGLDTHASFRVQIASRVTNIKPIASGGS